MEPKYRILSLDGGGTWSLIQIMALRKLFPDGRKGRAILEEFDLVAANSGGSFVLGGLLEDLTLDELFNYFEDQTKREAIFSPNNSLFYRVLRAIARVGPKHSSQAKLHAIKSFLPNRGGRFTAAGCAWDSAEFERHTSSNYRLRLRSKRRSVFPIRARRKITTSSAAGWPGSGSSLGQWRTSQRYSRRSDPRIKQCSGQLF